MKFEALRGRRSISPTYFWIGVDREAMLPSPIGNSRWLESIVKYGFMDG